MRPELEYVLKRVTDARELMKDIAAAPVTGRGGTIGVDWKEITLYGTPVRLVRDNNERVVVMWPVSATQIAHFHGLTEFLAWVLRRYW